MSLKFNFNSTAAQDVKSGPGTK